MLTSSAKSIAQPVVCTGVGLHSGTAVQVTLVPETDLGRGRYFVRTDLPDPAIIPAQVSQVGETVLSTELVAAAGTERGTVRTVEHLLAALVSHGVKAVRIEVDGPELPLLDGSAEGWCGANGDDFLHAIGKARTFGLARQIEQLRQAGLIRGGTLDNALVCDEERWLNPPLRFENEPVRHKILDLVGDLSLIGTIPQAHYVAFKASHRLHVALAKAIATPL